MTMLDSESVLPCPLFEGSEKRLVAEFSFGAASPVEGLRALSRGQLDALLCQVWRDSQCEECWGKMLFKNFTVGAKCAGVPGGFCYCVRYCIGACGVFCLLLGKLIANAICCSAEALSERVLAGLDFLGTCYSRCRSCSRFCCPRPC